jgi:hypothetical protein
MGWRTTRITTQSSRTIGLISRLVFDEFHVVNAVDATQTLRRCLQREQIADLQFTEAVAPLVEAVLDDLDETLAMRTRRRLALSDKLSAGEALARAGVPVAERRSLGVSGAESAAAELGYPVMVKGRRSYGGNEVFMASDEDSLRAILASKIVNPQDWFLERHVRGSRINYAAIVGDQSVAAEVVYVTAENFDDAGPTSVCQIVRDDVVLNYGRIAASVMDAQGPIGLNFMRSEEGGLSLIDVNPRVFGGLDLFHEVGVDFSDAYDAVLRGRAYPTSQPRIGVSLRVFPTDVNEAIRRRQNWHAVSLFLSGIRRTGRRLGFLYLLAEGVLTMTQLRNLRRRVATARSR